LAGVEKRKGVEIVLHGHRQVATLLDLGDAGGLLPG
jgi:hypothetical protein